MMSLKENPSKFILFLRTEEFRLLELKGGLMKKRILALLVILLAASFLWAGDDTPQTVEFPVFTVYDKEGNAVELSDFRGKPTVLNFWASWCNPCRKEMPDFDEAYKKYGDEVNFVMINMTDGVRETKESGQKFVDGEGYTFPVYFDETQYAAYTLGVSKIPTTFFLDAKGHGIAYATGTIGPEIIEKGIELSKGV